MESNTDTAKPEKPSDSATAVTPAVARHVVGFTNGDHRSAEELELEIKRLTLQRLRADARWVGWLPWAKLGLVVLVAVGFGATFVGFLADLHTVAVEEKALNAETIKSQKVELAQLTSAVATARAHALDLETRLRAQSADSASISAQLTQTQSQLDAARSQLVTTNSQLATIRLHAQSTGEAREAHLALQFIRDLLSTSALPRPSQLSVADVFEGRALELVWNADAGDALIVRMGPPEQNGDRWAEGFYLGDPSVLKTGNREWHALWRCGNGRIEFEQTSPPPRNLDWRVTILLDESTPDGGWLVTRRSGDLQLDGVARFIALPSAMRR